MKVLTWPCQNPKFKWMKTNHQETHFLHGTTVSVWGGKKAMAQHLTNFIIENSKLTNRWSMKWTAEIGKVLAFQYQAQFKKNQTCRTVRGGPAKPWLHYSRITQFIPQTYLSSFLPWAPHSPVKYAKKFSFFSTHHNWFGFSFYFFLIL